jgi:hypothetical protein
MHKIDVCAWTKRNWVREGPVFTEDFVTAVTAGRPQ